MKKTTTTLYMLIFFLLGAHQAAADNLYQVSLLRAYPGQMPMLIEAAKNEKSKLQGKMIIMRHSQGDHWDLMLLQPAPETIGQPTRYAKFVNFQHDFLASSDEAWAKIAAKSATSGLFHIEMFHALRGKHEALLKQRRMENEYLVATKRKANSIFITRFGSDVDSFTIGFYANLKAFAADPELDEKVFEKAAKDAGFKARSDIGFYLRKFLVSHQDTLATQVK